MNQEPPSGDDERLLPKAHDCPECKGRGIVLKINGWLLFDGKCPRCDGSGYVQIDDSQEENTDNRTGASVRQESHETTSND